MKNRELSNLIYSKLKSTPYLSEKEHFYKNSFPEIINNAAGELINQDPENWENGCFIELSSSKTKSGRPETININSENFIEFYGSKKEAAEVFLGHCDLFMYDLTSVFPENISSVYPEEKKQYKSFNSINTSNEILDSVFFDNRTSKYRDFIDSKEIILVRGNYEEGNYCIKEVLRDKNKSITYVDYADEECFFYEKKDAVKKICELFIERGEDINLKTRLEEGLITICDSQNLDLAPLLLNYDTEKKKKTELTVEKAFIEKLKPLLKEKLSGKEKNKIISFAFKNLTSNEQTFLNSLFKRKNLNEGNLFSYIKRKVNQLERKSEKEIFNNLKR